MFIPLAWGAPKCRKCRKRLSLQQKCRKVIPWLSPNAFIVDPLWLACPRMQKMQKTTTFAAEMQKSHYLTAIKRLQCLGWGTPKMQKMQKTTTFASEMQKSHSLTWIECIQCVSPWVGVPQNAESAENDYLCSRNAEKSFLDWDQVHSIFMAHKGFLP